MKYSIIVPCYNEELNIHRLIRRLDQERIQLFLVCIAFAFLFYGKTIAVENVNYGIEQLHQYNPELFKNNIGLLENGVSPRYFANVMVSALMKFSGMSWAAVVTFIIRINYVIYAVAAARAVCKITKERRLLFGIILVSCMFRSSLGLLAGFGLNGAMAVFIGTGTALALLAISFVVGEEKNWMPAWICIALAALMHVHEGMWGGCMVGIIWLAGVIAGKRINWKALMGFPVYVVVMLLVTVPSLLTDDVVDAKTFAEIYVNIRTPNHLLPTAWGRELTVQCFTMIVIPVLFLFLWWIKNRLDQKIKYLLCLGVLSVALWLVVLGVQYIATVIAPNTSIITMYLPKCFKYVTYVAMILYLDIAEILYQEKRYAGAACALWIVLMGVTDSYYTITKVCAVLLLVLAVFDERKFVKKEGEIFRTLVKLVTWEILLKMVISLHANSRIVIWIAIVVAATEFLIPYLKLQKLWRVLVCGFVVLILGTSAKDAFFFSDGTQISYVPGDQCLINAMGSDIYQMAQAFQTVSDPDEEFLADPYSGDSGWVQLVSERNCYCIYKSTPSSKKAVIDWYARIQQVENMSQLTAKELVQLMQEIDIRYVMVTPEQYSNIETSGLFETVVRTDTAAIYRIARGNVSK